MVAAALKEHLRAGPNSNLPTPSSSTPSTYSRPAYSPSRTYSPSSNGNTSRKGGRKKRSNVAIIIVAIAVVILVSIISGVIVFLLKYFAAKKEMAGNPPSAPVCPSPGCCEN
jgi:hypothetical protein